MTDKKISELPTITGANLTGTDLIPVVDVSSNATSKVTRDEFFKNITGNVGIGTSSPTSRLVVTDSTNCSVQSVGANGFGSFFAVSSDTRNSYLFLGNAGGEKGRITSEDSGALVFSNTTGASERMRIDSTGNVGIGTFNPGSKLDVNGTIRSNSWAGTVSSSSYGSVVQRGSNANGEYVRFADGTQICFLLSSISLVPANTTNFLDWTYPAAFDVSVVPFLIVNPRSFNIDAQAEEVAKYLRVGSRGVSNVSGRVALFNRHSSSINGGVTWTAYGRWF